MNSRVLHTHLFRASTLLAALVYIWIALIVGIVLLGSNGTYACNPDAVSVFTNNRECRQLDRVPMGPRVP